MEGESTEAYQARLEALRAAEAEASRARSAAYQREWWTESQSVLLARVVSTDTITLGETWGDGRSPRVTLRPERWLKGSGSSRRFRLHYTGTTSCGPYGGGDAVRGAVGELFVVFVRKGRPNQRNIITSLSLAGILDPELRERVEQAH